MVRRASLLVTFCCCFIVTERAVHSSSICSYEDISFYDHTTTLVCAHMHIYNKRCTAGVHVNGYVLRPDGTMALWVARRSSTKPTWPGKLDHIVAGGQPYGLSLVENVVKECQEEAGIPECLAKKAIPVGVVSYTSLQQAGIKRDVLFC